MEDTAIQAIRPVQPREPWNKGKLVGQKAPFKLKEVWVAAHSGSFSYAIATGKKVMSSASFPPERLRRTRPSNTIKG